MKTRGKLTWFAALMTLISSVSLASEFNINGFISAVGGKVIDSDGEAISYTADEYGCPDCFVADYPFAGVYDDDLTFRPDTTIGVQGNFIINDQLSATVQFVSQGAQDFDANVEWAYFSYKLNDTWTMQGGRKRLPLFYYSDFFDVGYAYTWIRAPADLYGWQIYGYDGLNFMYNTEWGDFSVTGNFWFGRDDDTNNQTLSKLYYYQQVDETWKNIAGTYLDLSKDWFSFRIIYMQNEVDRYTPDDDRQRLLDEKQFFYGISANADWGRFIVRTEYNIFNRPDAEPDVNRYTASLIALGFRAGDFTFMLTHSAFTEDYSYTFDDGVNPVQLIDDEGEVHDTDSFTIRWDFMPSVAFKLQYDQFTDDTSWNYDNGDGTIGEDKLFGDSTLISFGFDAVF